MPKELNEEGIEIPPNNKLSDLDKAWITLTYPRKTPVEGGLSVLQALTFVKVPNDIAGDILAALGGPDDSESPAGLMAVRDKFRDYNMKVAALTASKQNVYLLV